MTAQSVEALLQVWRDPSVRLQSLPQPPRNDDEVREIHQALLAELGPIGGWKVGAAGLAGSITYAPLPARCIQPDGALLRGVRQRWRRGGRCGVRQG